MKRIIFIPEIYIILFGFLINFWYEVSQVPFFLGVNRGRSYFEPNTFETRVFFVQTFNRAAFLDSIIVLGCHVINAIIFGTRFWFVKGGSFLGRNNRNMKPWIGYVISACIASGFLVLTEINAAVNDLWDYHESMPMIWELGLVPIIAMLFTPNLSFLLANRIYISFIPALIKLDSHLCVNELSKNDQQEYFEQYINLRYQNQRTTKKEWLSIGIVGFCLLIILIWYFGFFS